VLDDLRSVGDAFAEFWDNLSSVRFAPLAVAIAFHATTPFLRSRAWFNIIRDALPGSRVRYRSVSGAYLAGQGVNGLVPARAGDVLKLVMVHRRLPDASYPTLTATLVLETAFDWVTGGLLILYAMYRGVFPSFGSLPELPAFELSLIARHPIGAAVVIVLLVATVVGVLWWLSHRIRAFWERVRQGVRVLNEPPRYARRVVLWQVAELLMRSISVYYFLLAFGLPATVENALLVLSVNALSSLVPTPGGAGARQTLLAVAFAGVASQAAVLSFSVGFQVAIVAVNALLGFAALFAVFGGLRWRRAIARHQATRRPAAGRAT
jgi:hypothetical protein